MTETAVRREFKPDWEASTAFDLIGSTSELGYAFVYDEASETRVLGSLDRIDHQAATDNMDGSYVGLLRVPQGIGQAHRYVRVHLADVVVFATPMAAFRDRVWHRRLAAAGKIQCMEDGCAGDVRYVDASLEVWTCEAHPLDEGDAWYDLRENRPGGGSE